MGTELSSEAETPDERTIRLLNEEVALLRRRAAHSDKSMRRIEAVADAATARFAERSTLFNDEIVLLRKRVANSHRRERGLKIEAKAAGERSAERAELLHEVNHRAKNSIQMAISLLNLQRHGSVDPEIRLSLASAIERLSHIARVHTMLYAYSPDQQTIDFADYIRTFCAELRQALAGDIEVICEVSEELMLDSSRAINLALITSEGVTNALKHAFPNGRAGTVSVNCRRLNGHAILTVQDTGIGMPGDRGAETLGLKLIRTLVKGIQGEFQIESDGGTRLQAKFPL